MEDEERKKAEQNRTEQHRTAQHRTKKGRGLTADPLARSEMASASLRVSCLTPFMSFSSTSVTESDKSDSR